MELVDQWMGISAELPEQWSEARLVLRVADEGAADRAAALLGPLGPGQHGREIRFHCAPQAPGPSPDKVRRLLGRLDEERIEGELALEASAEAEPRAEVERPTLAGAWEEAVASLPDDWGHLYVEIEFDSGVQLDRAALLLGPLNPSRNLDKLALRFRVARTFGYGASVGMARRCLERLDRESIRGRLEILRSTADGDPVATQGPVWYLGGKVV